MTRNQPSAAVKEAQREPERIKDELIAAAHREATVEGFISIAGDSLCSSRLGVQRIFLGVQTIHPAFRARTYLWQRDTGRVSVIDWPHGLKNRPGYYHSPDCHVHGTGTELRVSDLQEVTTHPCELYGKLREQGYTDYLIVPLPFTDGIINTFSIATKLAGGLPARALDWFRSLTGLFVIVFERYAALETRSAALEAYLGRGAAREVLKGQIRSGYGRELEAAILFADLHGFTRLSSRLPAHATVRLLNTYFDCLVGPIEEHGGYVLKFIGDAILAFFPLSDDAPPPRPLDAVIAIRRRLRDLNDTGAALGHVSLSHAVCAHFGRVLYGNVGSSERLDFTVIGDAVNVAARGLTAAKSLGVDYVFTQSFVTRFGDEGLTSLGSHALEDVSRPVAIYSFRKNEEPALEPAVERRSDSS